MDGIRAKRLRTDSQLRQGFQAAFEHGVMKLPAQFQTMIANGATPRMIAQAVIAKNPFPGQPDYERICEMALAGEFDEFFAEMLSVSQN